jgi:hypothetical protein
VKPTKSDIYSQIKAGELFRVIRGESCVFRTPPEINAELLPTDHYQLLVQALYPLAEQYSPEFIQRELELGIRMTASDALGVFCAIRCYFMQISNEDNGRSNILLDRVRLAQFLTARYFSVLNDLKTLVMEEQPNDPAYARQLALQYLIILRDKHGVQLTID